MNKELPPILIVDDEKNMRLSLETVMNDEGYTVQAVESAEEALEILKTETYFLVITDARLGGMSGYDFLKEMRQRKPDLPILMITAYATPKLAVEAIKSGAIDYLAKPFAPEELLHAVSRCAERHALIAENQALKSANQPSFGLERIIGDSKGIDDVRSLIMTVAPTNATVLILGESGTGKELIAGAIHALSERREESYTRINCAAIPDQLLESELFGHEKGAFTGAVRNKSGRMEEADGGTVFLDEIGDMSRPLQAKLLRFLEDGTFTRVGGNQELRVDVRLIAATNRDIVNAIRANQFREDLFHRLNVVQFTPPSLREREGDVLILANHFLRQFAAGMNKTIKEFSPEAEKLLLAHHWPGNVRELRNAIERSVILETKESIQASSLPNFKVESRLGTAEGSQPSSSTSLEEQMSEMERDLILKKLSEFDFNVEATAEALQMTPHSLHYRMHRLKIELEPS
jgi:DNA-binding NtrC family response regulator